MTYMLHFQDVGVKAYFKFGWWFYMLNLFFKFKWYVLFFIIAEILIIFYVWHHTEEDKNFAKEKYLNNIQASYDITIKSYSLIAEMIFAEVINRPRIIDLYKQAYPADEARRSEIRQALHTRLDDTYKRLQSFNVRQLHFHLPDGTSFLRFHKPNKFGDNIFPVRPTVKLANTSKKTVQAFEEGRIFNGFRNVFPLFAGEQHIGSVEISVSFQAITHSMAVTNSYYYEFMLQKALIEKKTFKEQRSFYTTSLLSPDYWNEDHPLQPELVEQYFPVQHLKQIDRQIAPKITRDLAQQHTFMLGTQIENTNYIVGFLAIKNFAQHVVGYIVAYRPDDTLANFEPFFWKQWSTLTVIYILLMGSYYIITHNRRLLLEKNQALASSEDMFRQVNAAALDAIVVIDEQGNVMYWNQAAERIFGYTQAEASGKNLHKLIIPPDSPYLAAHHAGFKKFQQTGEGAGLNKLLEVEAMRRSGERFPVEVSIARLWLHGKWCAVGMVRDISERKQAEENLRKLSRAVQQSANSVVITDLKGNIEFVNPAFEQVTGYSKEEALGQNPRILKSDKQSTSVYKILWQTILSGQVWRGELINQRKNGELYWEQVTISPIKDANGVSTHYLAIKEDISARKQIENELQNNLRFLETLIQTIPMPVFYKDQLGNYLGCNADFACFMGTDSNHIIGKTTLDLVTNATLYQNYTEQDDRLLTEGGKYTTELELVDAHGNYHDVILTKATYKRADGSIGGLVGIFTDITELKQAKKQLERQNTDLIQLNQEKNEFLGIAAHDLKNPLSGIKGLAQEIRDNLANLSQSDISSYADMIYTNSQRMFNLISNLLDVNAIESGKLQVKLEAVDINSVLQDILRYQYEVAKHKDITLEYINQAQEVYATADADSLYQVLDNLISNAIKYSLPNTQTVIRINHNDTHLVCSVEDQGLGLSSADQEKLFGKFTRLSPKPTAGEHSTGLGLFIVKKLVDAMQGKIWCESIEGQGSQFHVALPLAHSDGLQQTATVTPASRIEITATKNPPVRILLAEDNIVNQKVAIFTFRKLGYHVDVANDGEEVLSMLQQQMYDIIFMDIHMPKLDGIAATERIRRLYGKTDPWIIALTASSAKQEHQQCFASGMQDLLNKPFDKTSLNNVLDTYFAEQVEGNKKQLLA